jgi:hypothetical protein
MLTDMKDSLRAAWLRATRSDREVPLTGYAQTKLSWARRVESFDELPAIYHDRMKALLGDRPLPHAVLTPTFPGFIRRENEKLLFSLDQHIYIWERLKGDLNCTCYALEDIHSTEMGMVLLQSWIEISGIASDGVFTTTTLKFNSVTDWLFALFINQIRGAAHDLADADREVEIRKFASRVQPNFKFGNYARRSLIPGEKVIDALWQPEIRNRLLTLLGRSFFRTIAMTHLLILTDRELIVIREDEASPHWRDESRYGGVWTYIPLDKITSISLTLKETNLLALAIHLPENDSLESLFVASQQPAVDRFLSQIEGRTSRATTGHALLP